ncbi:MAG: hypothetical protein B7X12_10925 [Halothiobacillus sp. 20-53-49]|nr:MAG: hypothetical protein B7X12_10925 [Halothiobacillus sp. 20-53-49]
MSANKSPSVDPTPAEPQPLDLASAESPAPAPLAPAQLRAAAYEEGAPDAPQAANAPMDDDEFIESPAAHNKATKPTVKRPYSARQASDKKRWRWARERVIQALYQPSALSANFEQHARGCA